MLNLKNIEGFEYKEPIKPPNKDIRNYGIPRTKQVWSRHEEYLDYDWSDGWQQRATADQIRYVDEELDRLYNGEWIYWDGEPLYINNYCYFFLQWMFLENEYYPEFRDTCLYYFRFIEICEKNKLAWGHILIKGRRLGSSSMEASLLLLNGLIERNKRMGIISKTGDDAKDIYDFAIITFEALPPFLQPSIEGANKSGLNIKETAIRITKDNKNVGKRGGLNNFIGHKKTALNSWDSGKIHRILIDEAGKWTDVDVNTYLKIVGKTLTKGASVLGKCSVVSTVNKGDKGGDRFKIIWEQSDQSKVNRLGQTTSKLFRIFIPAYYGYEGYIDRYGRSVVKDPTPEQVEWLSKDSRCPDPTIGAMQYLQMQRDLLENDEDGLQEEIRQAPFTWEEVFETAGKRIHFNKQRHEAQLKRIKDKLIEQGKDPEKSELGRRGWLREKENGDVFFEDDEQNGMVYLNQLPDIPNAYKKTIIGDKKYYYPDNVNGGGVGYDPQANSDATVDKGSDSAVIVRNKIDVTNPETTGKPLMLIIGRANKKSEMHKQAFLAAKFYGYMFLGERAPTDWVDWAKDNGYEAFMMKTFRSDTSWVYGLAPQNKEGIEQHLTEMVESAENDVEKIWFKRLIEDRLSFDVNNRTDYDACIADGASLMAIPKNVVKKKENKVVQILRRGEITTY